MNGKETLFGQSLFELAEICATLGLPRYTPDQIARWLYKKDATRIEDMTDLSKSSRRILDEMYTVGAVYPADLLYSADGTLKYLFAFDPLPNGETPGREAAYVETAYIPEYSRATLCVSTQGGCARACRFCVTGAQGLQRNLTAGEILSQYARIPEKDRITNIVYMGMGEPLDNLDAVLASLDLLTSGLAFGLSPRRITVSTVGILPQFETLFNGTRCNIAVSLHSPWPEERARLMPVERRHPVNEVLDFLKSQRARSTRRISFEYILFGGINDTVGHAKELIRLLHGIRCRVNLIPYNGGSEAGFTISSPEATLLFQQTLRAKGMIATIRKSRGGDIDAACGLMSTKRLQA